MNTRLLARLVAIGDEGRRDLLDRFNQYTADGNNYRAGLTVDEVELLIAIADDPDGVVE